MTDKKEQARKLREAADVLSERSAINVREWLQEKADELDPQAKERWERVREVHVKEDGLRQKTQQEIWAAVLTEANNGMVSKEELRKKAPWFKDSTAANSPSSYDQGVSAFLRVLDSL